MDQKKSGQTRMVGRDRVHSLGGPLANKWSQERTVTGKLETDGPLGTGKKPHLPKRGSASFESVMRYGGRDQKDANEMRKII